MSSSAKLKAWHGTILQTEMAIRESHYEKDKGRLELLLKQIAEAEAQYRSKQELIQLKKAALLEEEESRLKEIEAITSEKVAMEGQREDMRPAMKRLNLYSRIHGRHLISYFGVDYKDRGGRVHCPEGKVCASNKQEEEECNYWNCPRITSMTSTTANPKPIAESTTTMMTQLDISTN